MAEELSLDSMQTELKSFLKAQARNLAYPNKSLVFKLDNKNDLKIIDSDKVSFEVEEFFMETFRETFTDKQYKYVRVHSWEFELEFDRMKCTKIVLSSDSITFVANKNNKKEIKDIGFRIIVATEEQIEGYSRQVIGYLRRICKRKYIKDADNLVPEFYSLISFVKRAGDALKVDRLTALSEEDRMDEHPMEFLTPAGRKTVEKLKNFISRQDVLDFVVRQELSTQTEAKLRNIIIDSKNSDPNAQKKGGKKVKAE